MTLLVGVAAATGAAISFGTADFAGGLVARRVNALSAALMVQLLGALGLGLVLMVTGHAVTPAALGIGALAGLGVAAGLVALYTALSLGTMGTVAALTGLSASVAALGFDLVATGQAPTPIQALGIGLAILGGLSSVRLARVPLGAIIWSVAGGVAFAGSFIAYDVGAGESPISILFAARISAGVILGAAWVAGRGERGMPLGALIVLAGVLDTVANLLMLVAVSLIPVGYATAIATADPPIVTMFLARLFLAEALPRMAYVSVGLACAGIALVVIG